VRGWVAELHVDPIPTLLGVDDAALAWSIHRDLLDEPSDPRPLWRLPMPARMLRGQREDGSWRYPVGKQEPRPRHGYDQLATYEALLTLVDQYHLDGRHPAIRKAADFLLGCQTEEGDIRGIYWNQYTPNYTAAILAVLIEAGCSDDPRVDAGLRWLLSIRQDDGGWALPFRTLGTSGAESFRRVMPLSRALQPDRTKPFSHLITGIVLRAFASHPHYRALPDTRVAAELLATRFFKPDRYPDRHAAEYWSKLRYPFRWTDVLSALDSVTLVGISIENDDVADGLSWLEAQQGPDGLWHSAYEKARDRRIHEWVTFAAARVIRRAVTR
jgi:hypothetical protein